MIKRKRFVVLSLFVIFVMAQQVVKAQTNNNVVPIRLNEYSASNVGTPVDDFGQQSDWVELYNGHTLPVSLAGYYLSNDRYNLYKWKFPSSFVMGVGAFKAVWLSGRNTVSNGNYHASFTLDQCKNQWLILTSPNGVIRDSVFVQKTKEGHSWGRVDPANVGITAWRLYTAHSFLYANPLVNNYRGYCPKPYIDISPATATNAAASTSINAGGFADPGGASLVQFKLEDLRHAYDTAYHSCYNIFYTTNGSYPVPGSPNTYQVFDSLNSTIVVAPSVMIRAISVVNTTMACTFQDYLPSFCETNTYFSYQRYTDFDSNFGVLSIALEDSAFFISNGNPPNSRLHVEYYDKRKQVCEGYAFMNRPPNESWLTQQKGFDITIDDKMGFGCNFEGNIFNVENFSTTTRTVFPTLQLYAGDNEAHSTPLFLAPGTPTSFGTGLRDVFMQSLAAKYDLNVSPLHVKPVVAFINGRYWGVFTLKEVYDKYYEDYYNHQSKDSLDLAYYYNTEGYVAYDDGSVSKFLPATSFKTGVYDVVMNKPMNGPFYKTVTNSLDTMSLIDYMATNTYALNSDLWKYNIAYAKGGRPSAAGNKWHYYLWNMPTIFNFTTVPVNTSFSYSNPSFSTCVLFSTDYVVSPSFAGNGTGAMMRKLMTPPLGSNSFQTAYKNRYQDLMNTAFKCENVLKHFDFVYNLYQKEMRYHEDPSSLGGFYTAVDIWDTSMVHLRNLIDQRCKYVSNSFGARGSGGLSCFGLQGPYDLTINVEPAGAGSVRLNTILLDSYPWTGNYYQESQMLLKAIPTNTTFSFDHWEITTNHVLNNAPLSLDSIAISFITPDQITAVFTDKTRDLQSGVNVPTGFTPNGDNNNDYFKPVGSGKFESDYEMTVWNRWGQEVYRGTSPIEGWDGYYKGQQAPTGVYAYIIKYKNIFGEEKMLKGNVTLTR